MFKIGTTYTVQTSDQLTPVNANKKYTGVCTEYQDGWVRLVWGDTQVNKYSSVRLSVNSIVGIIEHNAKEGTNG